MAKNWLFVSQM